MKEQRLRDLLDLYDGLLLDAYGVLVAGQKCLPGAVELLHFLRENHRPFALVTNDASAHPETLAQKYSKMGLPVKAENIFSSGYLVVPYFAEQNLAGAHTWVMGGADVNKIAKEAGASLGKISSNETPDVIICADESGFDFLSTLECVISSLFRLIEAGKYVHLLLPNPDRIYPKGNGAIGIAAGSMALLIDDALLRRFGPSAPQFHHLGKPKPQLFLEAAQSLGTKNLCMVGDQLDTDVLGAQNAGFAAALITTGVGRPIHRKNPIEPDYLLNALNL